MENSKFKKAFILFIIGQFFLLVGTLNIGANFKVLPSWFALFILASFIGFVLFYLACIKLYKINKNYLRTLISLVIYTVICILADACARSKDDFYLTWSNGLTVSASFILCVFYVCFFLGTSDYFKGENAKQGNKKSKIAAIMLVILFVTERVLAFISSFNAVKLNLVFYSVCRFGSWGLQFVINAYIFAILIVIFVHMNKKDGGVKNNEEIE